MRHALIEAATKEELANATECANWLLDAIATATQDKRFLRGEPGYDEVAGEAILTNGKIAALRALKARPNAMHDYGKNPPLEGTSFVYVCDDGCSSGTAHMTKSGPICGEDGADMNSYVMPGFWTGAIWTALPDDYELACFQGE